MREKLYLVPRAEKDYRINSISTSEFLTPDRIPLLLGLRSEGEESASALSK